MDKIKEYKIHQTDFSFNRFSIEVKSENMKTNIDNLTAEQLDKIELILIYNKYTDKTEY